jgi:hypothetical protein
MTARAILCAVTGGEKPLPSGPRSSSGVLAFQLPAGLRPSGSRRMARDQQAGPGRAPPEAARAGRGELASRYCPGRGASPGAGNPPRRLISFQPDFEYLSFSLRHVR